MSYNRVIGIDGYVVGLKFADQDGSMDSAKATGAHGVSLGIAISYRAIQMIKPDLDNISILGFYLLTEDLEARRPGGGRLKVRLYGTRALEIHAAVKHKLQCLTHFQVEGGYAWAMTENHYSTYDQFNIIEKELAKQMRVSIC